MSALLREQPLLLLFVVAALGSLLGSLRVLGFSLGVAAVLFVGLFVSGLDPTLALPDFVPQLGLVMFVYGVGVAGGPAFFASLGRGALKTGAVVMAGLLAAALCTALAGRFLGLSGATLAGLYAGSVTNTPALAAVVEALRSGAAASASEPVVGYSVAYPMGVLGVLLMMYLLRRREAKGGLSSTSAAERLVARTVRVSREDVLGLPVEALRDRERWKVVFGRHARGDHVHGVTDLTVLQPGDLLTVVGSAEEVARVTDCLGEPAAKNLELDRSALDFRRVFVSQPALYGRAVGDVEDEIGQRFGAHVTRIRRGDVDVLPSDDLLLAPGDRVRVLAPRDSLEALAKYFGDSYRAISEVDVLTVGVGIALGLLLGSLQLSPFASLRLSLGTAGGPLVVGLCLGRLVRTGPLTWSMPYRMTGRSRSSMRAGAGFAHPAA